VQHIPDSLAWLLTLLQCCQLLQAQHQHWMPLLPPLLLLLPLV
jgi:hypothetical protein